MRVQTFFVAAAVTILGFCSPAWTADVQAPAIPSVTVAAPVPYFNDDPVGYLMYPFRISDRVAPKNSVFVFGGAMSSRDLWSTAIFNLNRSSAIKHYDNYLAGAAYQRDFVRLNGGLVFGGEIGLADRFGHYKVCCDTIVYSDSVIQSAEIWGGLTMRYEGISLFDTVRVSPGIVFGLSAISSPIGQEGEHQLPGKGNATLLFYIGLESAFALTRWPDTEFVVRVHHRSGAYGTLGGLKEGNNANTFGIRHHF